MMKRLILKLTETAPYRWLLLKVIPYIRFSMYYTSIRGWQYMDGYQRLNPGDIVLTNDKWKLTSLLIPGEWSHAALCVSKGCDFEIAEMTHTNFTKSTFFDLCHEATRVGIFRCVDWDYGYTLKVIRQCLSFASCEYDVSFEQGPEALYCSELVVESDLEHRLKVNNEDAMGLGMPYVSPTGISKATNIVKIWDSRDGNHN